MLLQTGEEYQRHSVVLVLGKPICDDISDPAPGRQCQHSSLCVTRNKQGIETLVTVRSERSKLVSPLGLALCSSAALWLK